MPNVIYKNHKGDEHSLELNIGMTIMEGAVYNGIDGIVAECGGSCACATCHVYIDEPFMDKLPPIGEYEEEMLEETSAEKKTNSRLSCQLRVTEELDGMVVVIPEKQ